MINKVGVIGAGQMGNGIAHVMAVAGLDVYLQDVNQEQLDKALKVINRNMQRQIGRGLLDEAGMTAALARIKLVDDDSYLGDIDLVIEAATENEEVKRSILSGLGPKMRPDALIATNTSSISVTRLAAVTDRPGKFMGMHFMNPVPPDAAGRTDPGNCHR